MGPDGRVPLILAKHPLGVRMSARCYSAEGTAPAPPLGLRLLSTILPNLAWESPPGFPTPTAWAQPRLSSPRASPGAAPHTATQLTSDSPSGEHRPALGLSPTPFAPAASGASSHTPDISLIPGPA
ncbi:unnamed protein product [Rangifer tarandus platyrhynchus]|uniref:Uncharacterized protein n=1 Tax=Rangifer tarandus platyrhynchus TaxID=3082113 RepID=A0AC59ZRK2_RANTA